MQWTLLTGPFPRHRSGFLRLNLFAPISLTSEPGWCRAHQSFASLDFSELSRLDVGTGLDKISWIRRRVSVCSSRP